MKNIALIVAVALVSLAGGFFLNQWYSQGGTLALKQTNAAISSPANNSVQQPMQRPNFALPDVQGHLHHMKEWDGKVIMLNFWATWCPPCQREMPEFVKLYKDYKAKGFTIVGVAVDEKQPVAEFIKSLGVDYPILVGNRGGIVISQKLGNDMGVLPYTVIIDRKGHVVSEHPGGLSYQQAEALIKPLL